MSNIMTREEVLKKAMQLAKEVEVQLSTSGVSNGVIDIVMNKMLLSFNLGELYQMKKNYEEWKKIFRVK